LSKVIKACFVKEKEALDLGQNNKLAHQDEFTKETAFDIFQETKKMIEELVAEAQNKAANILNTAENKAASLIEQGQTEYEIIKKKAYEEGLDSGYQEGIEKAREEINVLAEKTKTLAQSLADFQKKYYQENAEKIIDLVLVVSQKILNTAVVLKPEIISNIVENVLTEVGESEKIIIKVNPVHIPYLNSYDQGFKGVKMSKLSFESSSEVEPGGCIVVTENGFVEAQLDEQILLLKKALKEESNHVRL
jgi:flagellar assembly protein FliH